jgi:hypothetical protein
VNNDTKKQAALPLFRRKQHFAGKYKEWEETETNGSFESFN